LSERPRAGHTALLALARWLQRRRHATLDTAPPDLEAAADRRRKLAVLIGRMAWRRLDPARTAPPAEPPGEEHADVASSRLGEDPRPPS
jgi:hypothetical protein